MREPDIDRPLPSSLGFLPELAEDLRWTGSQFVSSIWERLAPEMWSRTQNPLLILRHAPQERFEELAADAAFMSQLAAWRERQKDAFERPTWFRQTHAGQLGTVAYFSMEFMLGEGLPIYSGGLGNVAGDQLKAASDLGVPVVGVGLLYQQGYFRQTLGPHGEQREALPYNEPGALQIARAVDKDGRWPRVRLQLPGRTLFVRPWEVRVGRAVLYLLDTNDPLNTPWDRGIAANLYAAGQDTRFLQEMVLGVAGWELLEKLGIEVDVCHLNEGHAALATLARASSFARKHDVSFEVALWATRAGNVFTTHTPVKAAFDCFDVDRLLSHARPFLESLNTSIDKILALGRLDVNGREPFNMAYLALRTSGHVNGVSQLHGSVSRELFANAFPRWPLAQVPVQAITNGVHIGTWVSAPADRFWARTCQRQDWTTELAACCAHVATAPDEELWQLRAEARSGLVSYIRLRYSHQLAESGAPPSLVERAKHVLDANALTLGFARRFTQYKRPNMILQDEERLVRLLRDASRPVQLIVAGKAHPNDDVGKSMVQRMAQFAMRPELFGRVIFIQDYDMALSQWLVGGVDVWINNPQRGNEASGTSGMKVLVNGGLNLSELDGWWDEAYQPAVGWALGDRRLGSGSIGGFEEAGQLYWLLENEILSEFYDRDAFGVPRAWVKRVRASMAGLTARYSCDRTVREYTERAYIPASAAFRRRAAEGGRLARELVAWSSLVTEGWQHVRLVHHDARTTEHGSVVHLHVLLGDIPPEFARVQLYADARDGQPDECVDAKLEGPIPGAVNGFHYLAVIDGQRPIGQYTPRIVPHHPDALVPLEATQIRWP